jgi:4-amino-4-deoxy-L-arabinose transferase-like glycosyltransferase
MNAPLDPATRQFVTLIAAAFMAIIGVARPIIALVRRHPLTSVVIMAVIVRLGLLLAFYPSLFAFENTGAVHGSEGFDLYAQNLLTTGVYGLRAGVPDAVLPPLYGYVLAGIYGAFGRTGLAVGIVHTLIDAASILLVARIAAALFVRVTLHWRAVGVLTALGFALYPYLIFQSLTVIDTPLFMLILHAWLYALIRLRERASPSWRMDRGAWAWSMAAGVLLGLGTLMRPVLVPLALFVALWYLFRLNLLQTMVRLAPVALIGVGIVLAWSARNTAIYGEFVAISVNGGANFYQGNNPDVVPYLRAGYDTQWTSPDGAGALSDEERNTPARDRALFQEAWGWLSDHSGHIPELLWVKFLTHWSIDVFPRNNPAPGTRPIIDEVRESRDAAGALQLDGLAAGDPVSVYNAPLFDVIGRWIHRLYFGGLFALAWVGMVVGRRAWRDLALLAFVQLSMTIMYVLFHPSTRYRSPSDPLLFAFAAWALVWGYTIWQQRRG